MIKKLLQFINDVLKNINYTLCMFKYTCKDCIGSQCCKDVKICKDFKRMR